jgi:hypothetical protein
MSEVFPELPQDVMLDEDRDELADPRGVEPAVRRSHGLFHDLASNVRETEGQSFDQLRDRPEFVVLHHAPSATAPACQWQGLSALDTKTPGYRPSLRADRSALVSAGPSPDRGRPTAQRWQRAEPVSE